MGPAAPGQPGRSPNNQTAVAPRLRRSPFSYQSYRQGSRPNPLYEWVATVPILDLVVYTDGAQQDGRAGAGYWASRMPIRDRDLGVKSPPPHVGTPPIWAPNQNITLLLQKTTTQPILAVQPSNLKSSLF